MIVRDILILPTEAMSYDALGNEYTYSFVDIKCNKIATFTVRKYSVLLFSNSCCTVQVLHGNKHTDVLVS